jgi:hypothetical protein
MKKYEWMVTSEKCRNFWKVGIQNELGDIYFSKKSFDVREDAQALANHIYKEEAFAKEDFVCDFLMKTK